MQLNLQLKGIYAGHILIQSNAISNFSSSKEFKTTCMSSKIKQKNLNARDTLHM